MGEPDPIIGIPLFGGYRISKKVGAGGMGAVYLVENKELNRQLAVKVLLTDRNVSAQTTARFLAEARAASAIRHRNIIDIIDCSQLPDGRHYILMEFLDGLTLRRYNKRKGPLSLEKILSVMVQVCSGLSATHARGIIHRDLKPSNIFIAPTQENPLLTKILDFGIAKLEDPLLAGEIKTRSQAIAGTPHYMSPEQARALRDVDHRADVYSVGAIVYELLTGKLPYHAHSIGELVFQQARTTPRAPIEINPDVSPAWSDLVMRAVHVEHEKRTRDVVALAKEMVEATPNGMRYARFQAPLLFADKRDARGQTFLPAVETVSAGYPMDSTTEPVAAPPAAMQATEAIHSTFDDQGVPLTADSSSAALSQAEALAAVESLAEEDFETASALGTTPPQHAPRDTSHFQVSETQIEAELRPTFSTSAPTQLTAAESRKYAMAIMFLLVAVIAAGVIVMWSRSQGTANAAPDETPQSSSAKSSTTSDKPLIVPPQSSSAASRKSSSAEASASSTSTRSSREVMRKSSSAISRMSRSSRVVRSSKSSRPKSSASKAASESSVPSSSTSSVSSRNPLSVSGKDSEVFTSSSKRKTTSSASAKSKTSSAPASRPSGE